MAPGAGVIVGPAGAEVVSDDGRLALSFPAGAVADDVAVVVESVPTEEWPAFLADLDPAAIVYRLEPGGLSFDEPVAFTMTVDIEIEDDGSVAAPMAVVVDDAGTGELVGLDVELDPDAGVAVVTGTIGHFSYFVEHDGGLSVGLEQISPAERIIHAVFEADAVVISLSRTDLIVGDISFNSTPPVEVLGATRHPGFTLAPGAVQALDVPLTRWKCTEEGAGWYFVTVRAALGGGLVSTFARGYAQGTNVLKSFLGLDDVVDDIRYEYAVRARGWVDCVEPVYEASTRSGRISVSGRVTDPLSSFTLNGTFEGGTATLSYQYGSGTTDPDTGKVTVSGSYTYTGTGSGTTVNGNGEYTIEGVLGGMLELSYSGEGCANPGGGAPKVCQATSAEIALTPVLP